VPQSQTEKRINFLFDNQLYELPNEQRPPCHRDKAHSYDTVYGRLRWDRPAQTITSGFYCMCMGRYVHPEQRRTLTGHEAARLQFFPDFFDFSPAKSRTKLAEIIGNAVPPKGA
jgi:DNA (cytosine-5)-methyltransferase 1